ncbi:hypothetical protein LPB140_11080 [Sphingorhabdus lutea]|uniref:Phage tail assembly chaperone n=2 Tax=Sphingorhabdus lutea TaxID=1913578 RepID=A0A1L3JDL9_9SPHN|nr:hypothetical protein LPB140_11080 [Sphingorhabdus lutea]
MMQSDDYFAGFIMKLHAQLIINFGWTLDQCWQATPSEIAHIFAGLSAPSSPEKYRDIIDKLTKDFPDE